MCSVKQLVTKQSVLISPNDPQYGAAQEEIGIHYPTSNQRFFVDDQEILECESQSGCEVFDNTCCCAFCI